MFVSDSQLEGIEVARERETDRETERDREREREWRREEDGMQTKLPRQNSHKSSEC